MFLKKAFFFFAIATILLAGCNPATATPVGGDLTASMSEMQGLVEMKNPDQAGFSAAADGGTLQVQGQVHTGEDGRVRLDLSSGTIVRVAPSTLFTLESNEPASGGLLTRLKLEAGKLWVVLNGGSLDVDTPSGLASVRGSFMTVWVDPETSDVWVACLEGWCQAENPTASLDLIAGQGGVLYHFDPAGTTPPPPPLLRTLTQAEIDEFLANNPELAGVMDAIIATASALPSDTPTSTPTPIDTPTPSCFSLSEPADGAELTNVGPVTFTWTEQPGAASYAITFTQPNGYQLTLTETGPSHLRYMDSLPAAGTFQWQVTAFDAAGMPLCTAEPFSFTKPAAPTPTFTQVPTAVQTDPTANATIIFNEGPDGISVESATCIQAYWVTATDPEGVSEVNVVYNIYGASGWLGSGSFSLPPLQTDEYKYYYSISTNDFISELPIDIYWSIVVIDLQGNTTKSPTYHFTDIFGCGAF